MSTIAKFIFGSNTIWERDEKPGTLFWESKMHVDMDGHPMAYHPKGCPPGLDFLANAGKPGNWWGISTDSSGKPHIQSSDHPAPGFHVSCTALEDPLLPKSNPARYVDSGEVPYLVLPGKPKVGALLGDLTMNFNRKTGKSSWAIYADIGPGNQIGEGSMKLCELLGLKSDKFGGTGEKVIVSVLFIGSKIGWPRPQEELKAVAEKRFADWGGLDALKSYLSRLDWSKFA